ncbi:MAG: hypothetical protein ACYC26_00485 [Phycisphaerales bacterium]
MTNQTRNMRGIRPILACWIGNAELLTPEQPKEEKEPAQRLFPDAAP